MDEIYLLSYFTKKSVLGFQKGQPFFMPINGYYKGLKIKDCKIIEHSQLVVDANVNLDKIAVMGISVIGIEKNRIVGKLNTLKMY